LRVVERGMGTVAPVSVQSQPSDTEAPPSLGTVGLGGAQNAGSIYTQGIGLRSPRIGNKSAKGPEDEGFGV